MSSWSPPSISRSWLLGISIFYVLVLNYAVIIAGEILLGLLFGLLLVLLYLLYRFVAAVEATADALHRIARQRGSE
jgi:hypothetical protein